MRSIHVFAIFQILFVAVLNSVYSQSFMSKDSSLLFFGRTMVHYGDIVTNEPPLKPLSSSHPIMIEQDINFINNTQRAWNTCQCYSKTGLALSYIDFNNPEKLGKAISLSAFVEPILYYRPTFQVSLRGSVGLSYLNKVYDEQSNPDNLFYSVPISYLLAIGAQASYKINTAFDVTLGARINHLSNGGSRKPNYGINFPMVSLGVEYKLNRQPLILRSGSKQTSHSWQLVTHFLAGRHLENDSKRIVMGFNVGVIKKLSRVNGVGVGGDVMYDPINKLLQ